MAQRTLPLSELADIVRSKNAGPFRITFDILFSDPARYRLVRDSHALTRETRRQSLRHQPLGDHVVLRGRHGERHQGHAAAAAHAGRFRRKRHVWLPAACAAAQHCCSGRLTMRIPRTWSRFLLAAPVAFVLAFFVVPFGVVAARQLPHQGGLWTLEHYAKVLGELYYWETLLLTFKLSLYVTLATLLIGYPLAYYHRPARAMADRGGALYIIVVTSRSSPATSCAPSAGWCCSAARPRQRRAARDRPDRAADAASLGPSSAS